MIRISSAVMNAGRDDDRISGLTPAAAIVQPNGLVGGLVVTTVSTDATGKTFDRYDGNAAPASANPWPWGLLVESANPFTGGGVGNDNRQGYGYDNINYARGGLYSVFHRPGNIVDIWDDGRDTTQIAISGPATFQNLSCPFVAARTWTVGQPLYATGVVADFIAGLIDNVNAVGATGLQIGILRAVSGTGATAVLTVELAISAVV